MAKIKDLDLKLETRAVWIMTSLLLALVFIPFYYYNLISQWTDFTKIAPYYLGSWVAIAGVFAIFAYIFGIRFEPFTKALIISYLILLVFVPPLYFDIHLYSCFDISKVTPVYLITIVIAACWIIRIAYQGECKIALPPKIILYPITAWFIVTFLSTILSICPYMSFVGTYKRYEGLLVLCSYFIGFYAIVNFASKEKLLYWLLVAILIISAISSFYGIIQFLDKDPLKWESFTRYRIISTFGNPVFVSAYFSMAIFVCLGMFMAFAEKKNGKGRERNSYIKPLTLIFYGLTIIFVYFSFSCTNTRATFVGLGISTFIFIIMLYGPIFAIIYYAILALPFLFLMYLGSRYPLGENKIALSVGGLLLGLIFFSHIIIGAIREKKEFVSKMLSITLGVILILLTISFNIDLNTSSARRFIDVYKPKLPEINIETKKKPSEEILKEETHSKKGIIQKLRDKLGGSTGWRMWMWTTGCIVIPDYSIPLKGVRHLNNQEGKGDLEKIRDRIGDILGIGIGPDTMGLVFAEYLAKVYVKKMGGLLEMEDRLHNEIFDTITSRGLIGLIIYLWLIVAFSIFCYKGFRKADKERRLLILGIYTGWLAYLIQNQFSFGNTPIAALYWMLMGIATKEIGPLTTLEIPLKKNQAFSFSIYGVTIFFVIFLSICAIKPYLADLYYKNGTIFSTRGEWEKTFSEYKKAISLNKKEVRYWEELNRAYINNAISNPQDRENSIKEAMEGAKTLLALTGNRSNTAYFTLGMAHFMTGDLNKAELYYKKAIQLNTFISDIHTNLGIVYLSQGKQDLAAKEFEEAVEITPAYSMALDRLINIWIAKNEMDKATEFLTRLATYAYDDGSK
ncbi:tetratricopeptide repeat protein, partial [bacterium]|nr:tetratricopeptide repeat protein [bacterium]MBU1599848.1 tetratricopeptide repeat protein [bacterium]